MTRRPTHTAAPSAATAASTFPTSTIRLASRPSASSSHRRIDRLSKVILRLVRRAPNRLRRGRATTGGAGGSVRAGGGGGGGGGGTGAAARPRLRPRGGAAGEH